MSFPFKARFAIGVESAMTSFMAPLVQTPASLRRSQADQGEGKATWRPSAGRERAVGEAGFPDQWSVSPRPTSPSRRGSKSRAGIEHNPSAVRLQNMTDAELQAELEAVEGA